MYWVYTVFADVFTKLLRHDLEYSHARIACHQSIDLESSKQKGVGELRNSRYHYGRFGMKQSTQFFIINWSSKASALSSCTSGEVRIGVPWRDVGLTRPNRLTRAACLVGLG